MTSLVVEQMAKVTLLVPRSELPVAIEELTKFEWFHTAQPKSVTYDVNIDALSMRAYKLFIELDSIIKELQLKAQLGIIETIKKGAIVTKKEKIVAKDWKDFLDQVEAQANPLLEELRNLSSEKASLEKRLSDVSALREALVIVSRLSIDLEKLTHLKHVHMVFTIVNTKDIKEIRNSLPNHFAVDRPLTKTYSALLIAGSARLAEYVDKVLKSFELKPFSIPKELPQNPMEAYKVLRSQEMELTKELIECEGMLSKIIEQSKEKFLVLHEATQAVYSILNPIRKSGDLKRIAIIEGYIPASYQDNFKKRFMDKWLCFIKPLSSHSEHEKKEYSSAPSLFRNKSIVKPFENITVTQGPPRYGEIDPTPLITLIFPLFYGIMFGDFGHGLILLLVGLILYKRGDEGLKRWGVILSFAGTSAIIVGTLLGEAFGFKLGEIIPLLGPLQVLELVERVHRQFNMESVVILLQVAILLGIFHLAMGLLINVIKGIKEKERIEVLVFKLPLLIMYIFGVFFALSFIGAGNSFANILTSSNPTPLIGLPVYLMGAISIAVVVSCMIIIILGKGIAIKMGKLPKEPIGMVVMIDLIEVLFERIPGLLANTVSYARLAILLIVHSALLFVVNTAQGMGLTGLPILFLGNAGIIMLEGLIVFIQDLRLHLYEWFTKFYEGSGNTFNKIAPSTNYVEIILE
ncbi:MAG: hypothetical protein H3Z53_02730 [archaeon]|nr:hypothetical protein [archaeon]